MAGIRPSPGCAPRGGQRVGEIAAARAALDAWKKAAENQGKLLGQLQAKVDEINTTRREIQLAADTCWPSSDTTNGPVRRAFKIPANKPIAK